MNQLLSKSSSPFGLLDAFYWAARDFSVMQQYNCSQKVISRSSHHLCRNWRRAITLTKRISGKLLCWVIIIAYYNWSFTITTGMPCAWFWPLTQTVESWLSCWPAVTEAFGHLSQFLHLTYSCIPLLLNSCTCDRPCFQLFQDLWWIANQIDNFHTVASKKYCTCSF